MEAEDGRQPRCALIQQCDLGGRWLGAAQGSLGSGGVECPEGNPMSFGCDLYSCEAFATSDELSEPWALWRVSGAGQAEAETPQTGPACEHGAQRRLAYDGS